MRSARKKHGKHNHVASFERAALVGCVSDGVAFWFPLVSRLFFHANGDDGDMVVV